MEDGGSYDPESRNEWRVVRKEENPNLDGNKYDQDNYIVRLLVAQRKYMIWISDLPFGPNPPKQPVEPGAKVSISTDEEASKELGTILARQS